MMRTRRFLLASLLIALFAGRAAAADDVVQLARTPDVSPDGKTVAFSYLGDIWVVDAKGGAARSVTTHRAHEFYPVFSPDGKWIAFSSNRHGSYNVFIIPTESGKPTRLTFDSSDEIVCGWTPDGKSVLFASMREASWPVGFDLYTVSTEGGRPQRITRADGRDGCFSPHGSKLAYVRGPGAWYRKGYRGSANDDIWICDADGTNNRQLTTFDGQDTSPMWSPDGKWIYYVSDVHGGASNIVRLPAEEQENAKPVQITDHKGDGVRRARMSRNGEVIVYECGSDLFLVGTKPGSKPKKLRIEVHVDDKSNTERQENFTSANEFALTSDDQALVASIHGELVLLPIRNGAKPVRMTHSTAYNHGAQWAPDASKVVFVSDRDGHDNIYLLEGDDPERSKFVEARRFKTKQLTRFKEAVSGVTFSPDGKRISYIRAGRLYTMTPDGGEVKEIVTQPIVIDYEWAPDAKWIAYSRMDGSFASEMYIVPATGATADNPARNVTRYATFNAGITWSADGKTIAFRSNRRGNPEGLFVLPLQKPTGAGIAEKPSGPTAAVEADWDDVHLRAKSITTMPVSEAAISPDGKRVAFAATVQGQNDLWVANADGSKLTRFTGTNQKPQHITWAHRKVSPTEYLDVVYFRDGNGGIKMVKLSNEPKPDHSHVVGINFSIKMHVKAEEEYTEMFDQAWRYLSENFYDDKFHGANWDEMRTKYRPLVKHVTMKEDLFYLLYLMMGELNASHLGVTGNLPKPEEPTAQLGLLFDDSHKGKGLKIQEVLKHGPADRRGLNLKPGDFVLAIDGTDLEETTDLSKLLNGKVNELISLTVAADADGKNKRHLSVQGVDQDKIRHLMYDRWVENNNKRVAELSKGKLGYIHIPGMDEEGLDKFVRALYSDHFEKDALVLDVRYNGGGFTHDMVLNYLGARDHTIFRQRSGSEGMVLRAHDRKWSKPLVLLINSRSYSDAEIFPHAFRTLGLGKLVGQATGGHVIGTGGVKLIDGSQFRIPRIGVYTTRGVNMDKEGVAPDLLIEPQPDQILKGQDPQLDKAVEVVLHDLEQWKKKHPPSGVAAKGEAPKADPATPPANP